jgi:hypothetical protein
MPAARRIFVSHRREGSAGCARTTAFSDNVTLVRE